MRSTEVRSAARVRGALLVTLSVLALVLGGTHGQTLEPGTAVTLSATSSDAGSRIAHVSFYDNGVLLGTVWMVPPDPSPGGGTALRGTAQRPVPGGTGAGS